MNEERDLLIKAWHRIRDARRGQLLGGFAVVAVGVLLVWLFHPAVTGRDDGGVLGWLGITVVIGVVFAIGGALIAASLGRSRVPGRTGAGFWR